MCTEEKTIFLNIYPKFEFGLFFSSIFFYVCLILELLGKKRKKT